VAPSPRRPVPPSTPAAPVAPSPLDYLGFVGDYIQPDDALGVFVPSYLRDEPQAREELAELQGAVRYVDAAIGRVLAALQSAGLEENTLVLFTTDHGVALPRAKCAVYDPGLATALILRLPARDWTSGRRFAEPISNVDVFPTLLDLVGLPVNPRVQGRSFLPLLDGREYRPRDCVFGEMTYHDHYDPRRCIRTRTHKLIVNFAAARSFMDPTQSWRPRTAPAVPAAPELEYHPVVELYDLVADPNEWHDVAEQPGYAAIRRELLTRLHDWMRATDDPLLRGAVTSPLHHWAVEALESAGKQ
ncbi:MAG: sulfatase-like hydrolase/transferase, partial [Chloroflexi bacterium]|nr:sulfatase-like hydrolase/transferase [Chloroflexota bacterium]